MKSILIIDSPDRKKDWLDAKNNDFQLIASEDTGLSGDHNCVIISEGFVGDKLAELVAEAKKSSSTVVVATENVDAENQERLLELGADDILQLPLCSDLLAKRLADIADRSGFRFNSSNLDFSAFSSIAADNHESGSFIVRESDFTNIYRFVLRILERLDKSAQMIIFTVSCSGKNTIEPEVLNSLCSIIQRSLRRGDISSLSGNQALVILMSADDDGAHLAANRIVSSFYNQCDDSAYDINYDICEIKGEKQQA